MVVKCKNTFYKLGKKTKEKKSYIFKAEKDVLREQFLKGSKPNKEIVYAFGKDGKLTSTSLRTLHGKVWKTEKSEYKYNASGLVQIKTTNDKGERTGLTMVVNDHKKNPIKLTHYNKEGVLSGFETAVYNYKFGTWVNDVYDKEGKLKAQKKFRFEPKPHADAKFNEQGDRTEVPYGSKGQFLVTEYKYDFMGNWVKKKSFIANKEGEKWKNKIKKEYLKRKIEYQGGK